MSPPLGKYAYRRQLRRLLITSRCFGEAPLPTSAPKWQRDLHLAWSLILFSFVAVLSLSRTIKFDAEMSIIERMLYILEYPCNVIIIAFIIFGSQRYATYYEILAQKLENLQSLICSNAAVAQQFYDRLSRRELKLLLIIFAFHNLCYVTDICYYDFDWLLTLYSNLVHNLPSFMVTLGLLQYELSLHFLWLLQVQLCQELKKLQCKLHERLLLPAASKRNTLDAAYEDAFAAYANTYALHGASDDTDFAELLENLRSIYTMLNKLHEKLVGMFSYIFLLNLLNSLISFSEEFFGMYKFFEQPIWSEWMLFFYRLLWLALHSGRILFILNAGEQIIEQKCVLYIILHEVDACESRLERVINRFLLQLNSDAYLSPILACGIIDLNRLAVGGFAGLMMIIVIFLIQIDLGNKSIKGMASNRSHWSYF